MISQELIALIYGAIVNEALKTCENMTEANMKLEKIGEKIGNKIVDEYMKEMGKPCSKLEQLVDKFCSVGVKRYLGADCRYQDYKQVDKKKFSFKLRINNNPLLKNLQILPDIKTHGLQYQSLIRGSVKGAFQVLKFKVEILLIYQSLRGDKNQSIFFVDGIKS